MADNIFEKGLHWAEQHPWWTAAGVGGVGLLAVLWLTSSSSSGSTNPGSTFKQQMQWQKLVGQQQIAAIKAQLAPQTLSAKGQTAVGLAGARSQTAQALAQARSQTNIASIEGRTQDTLGEQNLEGTLAGYKNNLAIQQLEDNTQLQELPLELQQQSFMEEIQAYIAEITQQSQLSQVGWEYGIPNVPSNYGDVFPTEPQYTYGNIP